MHSLAPFPEGKFHEGSAHALAPSLGLGTMWVLSVFPPGTFID